MRSCRLSVLRTTILLVNWLWFDLIGPKSAAFDELERLGRDVVEWFTRSCTLTDSGATVIFFGVFVRSGLCCTTSAAPPSERS